MGKKGLSSKVKRSLFVSGLSLSLCLTGFLLFYNADRNHLFQPAEHDTYDPLTYKMSLPSGDESNTAATHNKGEDEQSHVHLENILPLVRHGDIMQRLNSGQNGGSVYTFFNDAIISRLSPQEQEYHKTMLKKFIQLYHSLGFNVHILNYIDAVINPNATRLMSQMSINEQAKAVILSMLAWQAKLQENGDTEGGLYSDYEIFPMSNEQSLNQLTSTKMNSLTTLKGYGYRLMVSDITGVDNFIESLLENDTTAPKAFETDQYNSVFADYSINTWRKLLNTDNLRFLIDEIPKILNAHLHRWRLARYDTVTVVDTISIGSHYFSKPILLAVKSLLKTSEHEHIYPIPTISFVERFVVEIMDALPWRTSMDTSQYDQERSLKQMQELLKPFIHDHQKNWNVEIVSSLDMNDNDKNLKLVSIPHPLSLGTAIDLNTKGMVTSSRMSSMNQHDFFSQHLVDSQNVEDLKSYMVKDHSTIVFNSETLSTKQFTHAIALNLGFDIDGVSDEWGVEYQDKAKPLNEVLKQELTISEGDFKMKMEMARNLVTHYESPNSYTETQRQSEETLKTYRDKMKNTPNSYGIADDLESKLDDLSYSEIRHDPMVDFAELWNPNDTELWWLAKSLRYIDEVVATSLANW